MRLIPSFCPTLNKNEKCFVRTQKIFVQETSFQTDDPGVISKERLEVV